MTGVQTCALPISARTASARILSDQDRAKRFATLYLEDLADLLQATVSPHFSLSRYADHLINEAKVDNSVLEADDKPDPRFSATAEQLKAKGVTDFQLTYALDTISRLARTQTATTGARKGSR